MIIAEAVLRVCWYDPVRHMRGLVGLHGACFPDEEWRAVDFQRFYGNVIRRNVIKVMEDEEGLVYGSLLYTLGRDDCRVRRLAVHPEHRRKGLGLHMMNSLVGRRSPIRRDLFTARVRESRYEMRGLLIKKLGFTRDPAAGPEVVEGEPTILLRLSKNRP